MLQKYLFFLPLASLRMKEAEESLYHWMGSEKTQMFLTLFRCSGKHSFILVSKNINSYLLPKILKLHKILEAQILSSFNDFCIM